MTQLPLLVGNMASNLLVLVGLAYLISRLLAALPIVRTGWHGALLGVSLGCVAGILIHLAVEVQAGTLLDLGSVVVLVSGFVGGPVVAIVAAGITMLFRVAVGGNVLAHCIVIAAAAAVGIAANKLHVRASLGSFLVLGLTQSLLRAAMPFLSYRLGDIDLASASALSLTMLPLAAVFFPLGTAAMGLLLRFEDRRADDEADLRSENQSLAESDSRFQAVFDRSSVAMMWTTPDGGIVRANQRMADLLGYAMHELAEMRYADLLVPADRGEYFSILSAQAATGLPPEDRERRYLRKDGGVFWGLRSITLVKAPSSQIVHKFVIIQDVTERRQSESRIRFQAELLESVEQAVVATDTTGTIIFWSRFAETLFGWPVNEVLGKSIGVVAGSLEAQIQFGEIGTHLATGRSRAGESTLARRDGSTFSARITKSAVRDDAGNVVGVVAVVTDISEEKRGELALLEEQRTLAVLNRTAAKLNAEHDLTALLQAVSDAGVELTGAQFGALYSTRRSAQGDDYPLYALSGIGRDVFATLRQPREIGLFDAVLGGKRIVRWDDLPESAADPTPDGGSPNQVRSYLGVPLVSRAGDIIGALFFGHASSGAFGERSERILEGIAAHAAIAIEKTSLFQAAQQEIETRKKAEQSLSKSKARFRDFAEAGSDLLWETDAQFRVASIVGDSRSVFGMSEDELIGRTAWEFAKADTAAADWQQHILDYETQQPFRNFEYQIIDRNGATRWISANGRPYVDENGDFAGFRGASTNIAARKHAEAKLAASARQQQSAAVLSQLALQGVPRDDLYQVAVDLVARTLGVELVGILELSNDKRVLRLRAGSGWPAQSVNIRAVPMDFCPPVARSVTSDVPVHFSRRNFNLIPGLQNDKGSGVAIPIGEKAGRTGILVVCSEGFRAFSETDINFLRAIAFVLAADAEQRKAEATLRLRDRALEAIGEGIVITDAAEFDNPITYVNPAFERLTGYAKEEAVARNARFLQGRETDSYTLSVMRNAVESDATFRGSILNYRKDGTSFWNGLTVTPIRDPSGTTTHFVGILSDETERIQLASLLRQAQKMESLGHLTGGVAHDFNNLLAVILGNAEILCDEVEEPALKAIAELVMATAEKGADLTQRLLAFGRRQALRPETLDLGVIVASLLDMLNRTLGEHIALTTRSSTDQPAYVDRSLFESAIINLVLNARDAMPNGGALSIESDVVNSSEGFAGGLLPGDYVRVSVTDTGVGMPEDVLDRAFDPFFTTKAVGMGSGMGLSMVYGFAKQSGGHIAIESHIGQGTTVHLYLPMAESEVAKPLDVRQEPQVAGGSERILLVEDEPQLRRFVLTQLKGLGYSVLEAEAGGAALEILRSDPRIDLLFTDLLMPGGMSGFDLVKHARELNPELKILLTTGYAAEADSMLADVGESILKKPYKKQQLAEALRSVLDQAA